MKRASVCFFVVCLGCGGAKVQKAGPEQHRAEKFIVTQGLSRLGPADAEVQATARIAELIHAECLTVAEAFEGLEGFEGCLEELQKADWLKPLAKLVLVEAEPGRDRSGFFRATAVLERVPVVNSLRKKYLEESRQFRLDVEEATKERRNLVLFTARLRKAEKGFCSLAEKALLIRVISRAPSFLEEFESDKAEFLRLQDHRRAMLKGLELTVLPGEADPHFARQPIIRVLVSALASLGLVVLSDDTCRAGYAVVPSGLIECDTRLGEVRCALVVKAKVVECASKNAVASLDFGELGSAVGRDSNLVKAAAVRELDEELTRQRLKALLRPVLPLP